jgi:hypothetical protein
MSEKISRDKALEYAIEVLKSQPELFKEKQITLESDKKETGQLIAHHVCTIAEYFRAYLAEEFTPEMPKPSA